MYPARHHFTAWRRFCQPSRPFRLTLTSNVQPRLPSRYRQQQAGTRRFDTSTSRYPEPGRTMATLGRRSWPALCPFQRRMTVQRTREQRPSSLRESLVFTSRRESELDREQIELAAVGFSAGPNSFYFLEVSDIDQQLRHSKEQTGTITAPSRHPTVTESDMLRPNIG